MFLDTIKIIEFLKKQDIKMVIDFIADGKDVEEKSALSYIEKLESTKVPIATICGRYYAMDSEGIEIISHMLIPSIQSYSCL